MYTSKLSIIVLAMTLLVAPIHVDAQDSTEEKGTVVDAEATQVAKQLHTLLNQPVPRLATEARHLASEILASLEYDREIAQYMAWEQLLQETRVDVTELADQAQKERADLKQKLQDEMDDICEAFPEGPQRDRQIVLVIQSYRPTLSLLKQQDEVYRNQISNTDGQLLAVRHKRMMLERSRRLKKQGLDTRRWIPPALPELPTLPAALPSETESNETLADALKSVKEL